MMEFFESGPARGEDLLLKEALTKDLVRDGWMNIVHWPGGVRVAGLVRHTSFALLHLKHVRGAKRHALVRQATLRLLEHRASVDLADELCLATDADLGSDSIRLLSSAGIEWRRVAPFDGPAKRISLNAGTRDSGIKMSGPKPPIDVVHEIRGVPGKAGGRPQQGYGAGHIAVRMCLQGAGEIDLPGTLSVAAQDSQYQNGILIKAVRVKLGIEIVLQLYCLNRDARPSSSRARYAVGPLVEDRKFADLVRQLEMKVIGDKSAREAVQVAVWDLLEDGRLSKQSKEALERLPVVRRSGD